MFASARMLILAVPSVFAYIYKRFDYSLRARSYVLWRPEWHNFCSVLGLQEGSQILTFFMELEAFLILSSFPFDRLHRWKPSQCLCESPHFRWIHWRKWMGVSEIPIELKRMRRLLHSVCKYLGLIMWCLNMCRLLTVAPSCKARQMKLLEQPKGREQRSL